jgi:hypothetical protein
MIRTFFSNNRLTLAIAFAALVILPLLASLAASNDSTSAGTPTTPAVRGMAYPSNYQQDFTRYETVQRPDGTIRDVYINPIGLNAIRSYHILPIGTEIVIEAYNALKNADGNTVTDAEGHYIRGDVMPMIHVREKRGDWSDDDFTSNARNGGWNYGSFYTATGAIYHESLNACFLCHNTAPEDFTYSTEQMDDYVRTGEPDYFMCPTTGRTACE